MRTIDKWLSAIIALAIVAVLVSRRSTTSAVLQSAASALSNILASIVSPITSGSAASSEQTKG